MKFISLYNLIGTFCDFYISLFSCAISIITCIFTILMYILVDTQLKEQIKQFNENENKDINTKNEIKIHVDEIKKQILIDSLTSFLEKKQRFIYCYDILYEQLKSKKMYLVKQVDEDLAKESDELEKRNAFYDIVVDDLIKVDVNLNYLKDMISIIDKKETDIMNKINVLNSLFNEIRTRNGVVKGLKDIDSWLSTMNKNKESLIDSLNVFFTKIHNPSLTLSNN